jgi:hypothetical protein
VPVGTSHLLQQAAGDIQQTTGGSFQTRRLSGAGFEQRNETGNTHGQPNPSFPLGAGFPLGQQASATDYQRGHTDHLQQVGDSYSLGNANYLLSNSNYQASVYQPGSHMVVEYQPFTLAASLTSNLSFNNTAMDSFPGTQAVGPLPTTLSRPGGVGGGQLLTQGPGVPSVCNATLAGQSPHYFNSTGQSGSLLSGLFPGLKSGQGALGCPIPQHAMAFTVGDATDNSDHANSHNATATAASEETMDLS